MSRRTDPRTTRLPVPTGELPQFTPVPRQCQRHDGWTPERQRAFIEALADTGSVEAACRAVDMSAVGAYYLRRQPGAESFRKAWEAALQLGVQRIEDVAMDRALNGVDLPVYSYGKLVGTRRTYNDRLLMFMLRNRAPERFTEGRARAMNAVDLTRLEQEKKKWRREWELEHAAGRENVSPAEVRASIDRKIEALRRQVEAERQREWAALSDETRAAWERFEALKARDLAAQGLLTGTDRTEGPQARPGARSACAEDSQANGGERRRLRQNKQPADKDTLESARPGPAEGERNNAEIALPPPGWRKRKPVEDEPEPNPRWRTIKDERWGP